MSFFKYCGESGLLILKNLQLKVTPPNKFNDPFEFNPVVRNPNAKEYAEKMVKDALTNPRFFETTRKHFPTIKNFGEFQLFAASKRSLMLSMLEANMPRLDKSLNVLNTLSQTSGVVCFSSDPVHPLMWAHYSAAHTGVVVEFDENADLFKQIAFLKVEYDSNRVVYNPDGTDQKKVVELFAKRKSEHWKYEQEYRLLVELAHTHKQIAAGATIFLMDIDPHIIKSVTIGLRARDHLHKEVVSLASHVPLTHLEVYQIREDENEFKLHRERLK